MKNLTQEQQEIIIAYARKYLRNQFDDEKDLACIPIIRDTMTAGFYDDAAQMVEDLFVSSDYSRQFILDQLHYKSELIKA